MKYITKLVHIAIWYTIPEDLWITVSECIAVQSSIYQHRYLENRVDTRMMSGYWA